MGNVPPSPRRSNAGRSAPRHMSSIPPVPNVILARPGRTQPCPISDACWSPAMPAIGGAPGERGRVADDAGRVDDGRQHARRDAQRLEHMVVPPVAVAAHEAGDAGVGCVGDVERLRSRAPTRSTCRRCRSRGRRGCARGRPCRAGTRPSWPTGSARAAMPSAGEHEAHAERCAGPASRCPDRRARRWRGPTRSSTPAGSRCRPRRRGRQQRVLRGPRRGRRRPSRGRRTRRAPGAGDDGSTSR